MDDYGRVEKVIRYLDNGFREQPSLAELASKVGLSESHFQRLFQRWAGVSPKTFLQSLTHAHAKKMLSKGASVLDASLDSGLSGPGRLHDLCVKLDAASPGEIKSGGEGWTIRYGVSKSPFGAAFVAAGPRGVCKLAFIDGEEEAMLVAELKRDWKKASLERDDMEAKRQCGEIFSRRESDGKVNTINTCVVGTQFQVQVWKALLSIPQGSLTTYGTIAKAINREKAVRAVGTAIGRNPIAYLIPCHRVIRESGALGGYRWGLPRKQALIGRESVSG